MFEPMTMHLDEAATEFRDGQMTKPEPPLPPSWHPIWTKRNPHKHVAVAHSIVVAFCRLGNCNS